MTMRFALLLLLLPVGSAFSATDGEVFLPRCGAVIDSVRADAAAMADYSLEQMVSEGLAELALTRIPKNAVDEVEKRLVGESAPLTDFSQVPGIPPEELSHAQADLAADGGELRLGPATIFRRVVGRPYVLLKADETSFGLAEEIEHLHFWRLLREIVRHRKPTADADDLAFKIMATVRGRLVGEARARCIQFEDRFLKEEGASDPVCIVYSANYPRFHAVSQLLVTEAWILQTPRWKNGLWWRGQYHRTVESLHERQRQLLSEAAQRTAHWFRLFETFFLAEAKKTLGETAFADELHRWTTMKAWDRFRVDTNTLPYAQRLIVEALRLQMKMRLEYIFPEAMFTQLGRLGPVFRQTLQERFREAGLNKVPAELQVAPPTRP